jgi:hypothetical protein
MQMSEASHLGEAAQPWRTIGDGMTSTPLATRVTARRASRAQLRGHRIPIDLAIALALTCLSALATVAAQTDTAAEIIAAQIRTQGYTCTAPVSAKRDQQAASQPNVKVWVLSCGNARYRVRLVPDMAAQVTQLE